MPTWSVGSDRAWRACLNRKLIVRILATRPGTRRAAANGRFLVSTMRTISQPGKDPASASRRVRGFTLIELMVVLVLVALASALVMPAIGHAYGNLELRTAASATASLFAQARTHSVYEARSYQVIFGPAEDAARQLLLVRDDGRQIQQVTLPAHITVLGERGDGLWDTELQPIHFFPDGTSELLQLDLRSQRQRHVQLSLDPLTARARVTQIYDEGQP